MKIIILGAGQVGATIAEQLARENNDIVVVDHSMERLRELRDRLDIALLRTRLIKANYFVTNTLQSM